MPDQGSASSQGGGRRARRHVELAYVEKAIAAIARGEMVILVDDEDRENEGDLVLAADKVTPEAINFMASTRAASSASRSTSRSSIGSTCR